jgi:hypothetical protein
MTLTEQILNFYCHDIGYTRRLAKGDCASGIWLCDQGGRELVSSPRGQQKLDHEETTHDNHPSVVPCSHDYEGSMTQCSAVDG